MFFYEFRSDDTLTMARLTRSKHLPHMNNMVGQQFCEMSLYEITEVLYGGFEKK